MRTFATSPFPRNANQIEERIADPRVVKSGTLLNDVFRLVSLVHECERIVVAGLNADSEPIVAGSSELLQLRIRLY